MADDPDHFEGQGGLLIAKASLSPLTLAIASAILVSAFFVRQWMLFIKNSIGERPFELLVALFLVLCSLGLFVFESKRTTALWRNLALGAVLVLSGICAWQPALPEEKLHFLEYAVLGWFAHRDFLRHNEKQRGFVQGFLFASLVGILDEGIQELLPYRYFNLTDLVSNVSGGFLGSLLYWFHK